MRILPISKKRPKLKSIKLPIVQCRRCGKDNPFDTTRCIKCKASMRWVNG